MAGAGKKKSSRSYRRKYKKYYKKYYRRKSKIYKNILGTSTANQCQMCCVVRRQTNVWFQDKANTCYFPIVVNSASAHLRPQFLDYYAGASQIETSLNSMTYMIGPQMSESYRKALTIFGEQKINGVYVTVRPINQSRNYKILSSWDRSYIINRGPISTAQKGDFMWDYYAKMALLQGKGPFLYSGDTKYSYRTKCVAKNLTEKTTFHDTAQDNSKTTVEITLADLSRELIEWNNFGTRALISQAINPNFSPMCVIPIYREGTDLPEGKEEFEVVVKYYFTFRNPGAIQTDSVAQQQLLLTNLLQCTVTDLDSNLKANIGDTTDPTILQNIGRVTPSEIKPEPEARKRLREEEVIEDEDTLPPDEAPRASYQPTEEEKESLERVAKLLRTESVDLEQLKQML